MHTWNDVVPLVSELRFPEGMRWHDGCLWHVDMHDGVVVRLDPATGASQTVMKVQDQLSGLAWLTDGSLLVSSMRDRQVLRRRPDGTTSVYADLRDATPYLINDIVLGPGGHLFVGDFGYHLYEGDPFSPGSIFRVDADGSVSLAAGDLHFPNTAAILPGSTTLVLPESFGGRITAFDIAPDGSLVDRRTWAEVPEGTSIDGCCVDAEGALWLATLWGERFIRMEPGGLITDEVPVPGRVAIDCRLGGPDGRTLYLATADDVMPEVTARSRLGRVDQVLVPVGATGHPH
jgi:sugar lactone lactonase YvrE